MKFSWMLAKFVANSELVPLRRLWLAAIVPSNFSWTLSSWARALLNWRAIKDVERRGVLEMNYLCVLRGCEVKEN